VFVDEKRGRGTPFPVKAIIRGFGIRIALETRGIFFLQHSTLSVGVLDKAG